MFSRLGDIMERGSRNRTDNTAEGEQNETSDMDDSEEAMHKKPRSAGLPLAKRLMKTLPF